MRRFRRTALLATLVLLLGPGCDDEPTAPVPGRLIVALTTPNADDAAVLFTVGGGVISSASVVSSTHLVFFRLASADSMQAVVVGNVGTGPLATIEVPNVNRASRYKAEIVEVAARDNAVRESLAGYSLNVIRE